MPAVKPTPTDIADVIAKCEAGPDPVSGEYEFPDYRDAGSHWFCVLYDPEGKRVCDGFGDTAGAVEMPQPTPDGTREVMSAAEWDAEIERLKKPK
jgi:hypothetical protein